MHKIRIAFAIVIFAASLTSHLAAWEKPTSELSQTQEIEVCSNLESDVETSFSNALSSFARRQFEKFSVKQKKKAMELADEHKMEPDAAVGRISAKR